MLQKNAESRVLIAQDVLKNLQLKHIFATHGVYLESRSALNIADKDIGDLLKDQTCEACAIGSLFIAATERFDEFKTNEVFEDFRLKKDDNNQVESYYHISIKKLIPYLERYFELEQLMLIEIAFEGSVSLLYREHSSTASPELAEKASKARNFNSCKTGEYTAKDKLERIMMNILENKGEFIP